MRPAVCSFLFFFILRFSFRLVRDSCSSHLLHHNAAHSTNCEPLQTLATPLGPFTPFAPERFWALPPLLVLLLPLPFIVIAFCCSSVSLELFPFLIHFACLWHVQACLAQAPSGVYVMSSLCIQRCNLLQIYAATNQNNQKLHVHSQLIRYLPCTLSLYLSLSLSLNLPLAVLPLSMQIQLTLQRVGSLLSPSPTVKGIQS